MKWSGKYEDGTSIGEIMESNCGIPENELLHPAHYDPNEIPYLQEVAQAIQCAKQTKTPITVFTDYDCDGITSAASFAFLFEAVGITEYKLRLPKRFSEGFGISLTAIEEIAEGLLIIVDNGITALEQVRIAKDKGLTVIILDHHIPGNKLPPADIIIDPHLWEGMTPYCGAGLVYKLSEMFEMEEQARQYILSLAALGTIADVVPLTGDNRHIVRKGLHAFARKSVPLGLRTLIYERKLELVDEQVIAFTIAPIINAAGRLYDDGASLSCDLLTAKCPRQALHLANRLITINEKRKELVEKAFTRINAAISKPAAPICVYDSDTSTGIVGLIAGKLSEMYQVPAIVLTDDPNDDGVIKGSGRSHGGVHLKELLDKVQDQLLHYGGHAGAVGLSLKKSGFHSLQDTLYGELLDYQINMANEVCYDMTVDKEQVLDFCMDQNRYGPFGQDAPKPIVRVDGLFLLPQDTANYRLLGKDQKTLMLETEKMTIIAFGGTAEFLELGCPSWIDAVGYLSFAVSRGVRRLQLEAIALQEHEVPERSSTLLREVQENFAKMLPGR